MMTGARTLELVTDTRSDLKHAAQEITKKQGRVRVSSGQGSGGALVWAAQGAEKLGMEKPWILKKPDTVPGLASQDQSRRGRGDDRSGLRESQTETILEVKE